MTVHRILGRCIKRPLASMAIALIFGLATASAQQGGAPAAEPAPSAPTNSWVVTVPAAQSFRTGGKTVVIPSPESGLLEIGDDYRVVLDPVVPDSNRLIAAFVAPQDAQTIRSGSNVQLLKYGLVEVPRRAEFIEADRDAFKQVSDAMAQQFGSSIDTSMKNQEDEFNRRLKELNPNAPAITFDKAVPLGIIFSKQDACAFGVIMPVSAKGNTIKMITSIGVLRAQNRILFLYLYSVYKDEDTVKWLRATSEQWSDAILKANP